MRQLGVEKGWAAGWSGETLSLRRTECVPYAGGQLTPYAAHSTVKVGPYGRHENPDWPALEERRHWRYLPGHPAVLRGIEHHGDPAQVRRRGRGADPCAGRARRGGPENSRVFSCSGR